MGSPLSQLRDHLRSLPAGRVPGDQVSLVETALAEAWPEIAGSGDQGMRGSKLRDRTEKLFWNPPILTFTVERHGGTMLGSTRAELHEWSVNIDTAEATCRRGRHRQLIPRDESLKVKPLAEAVAKAIIEGHRDSHLKWRDPGRLVQVLISEVIRPTLAQTTSSRRRRFRATLEPILAQHGWVPAQSRAVNTYEKVAS